MNRPALVNIPAILILLLALTCYPALAESDSGGCVHGNNKSGSTTRDLAKFDRLEVSGAFEVRVTAGRDRQTLRITGEENLLPLIATEVNDGKLSLRPTKSICANKTIEVEISAASLAALDSSGSDNVRISGLDSDKFSVNMSGSGDVDLAGRSADLEAVLAGAGRLDAHELKTGKTSLNISGSGNADVYASELLKVEIVGVGEVNYYGNPKKVEKQIIGVGNLNPM